MKCNIVFILLFTVFSVHAQVIEGVITDADTKESLPYANITLLSKNIGTSSNEKVRYTINVEGNTKDSLLVSYIGYASKKISLSEYKDRESYLVNFELNPDRESINEVVLKVKKQKYSLPKKIGIDKQLFKFGSSTPYGYENCVLIENEERKEGKLSSITIFLKKKEEDGKFLLLPTYFRIKFYAYNKRNDLPGALLSYDQILIKPENKTQKFKVDLKDANVLFPQDGLCVGIETINPIDKKPNTMMYVTAPNLRFTYDDNAFTWKSYRGKKWRKHTQKFLSKVFGKRKQSFTNPIVHAIVRYKQ